MRSRVVRLCVRATMETTTTTSETVPSRVEVSCGDLNGVFIVESR